MDKTKLNEEIVLCRPIVKRAKVCIIRKLIKKIKLLRSCKKEELREKKLRKGRRLAAEVHMMKTLRPDYVTKFALLTENYVSTGSNTKLKRKRNACAKLVKHKDLVEKVKSIREKFFNWQEELPILLKSSKRKRNRDEEANTESNETNDVEKTEEITVNEELLNDRLDVSQEEPKTENEVTKISDNKVEKPKPLKVKLKDESNKPNDIRKPKKKAKKKEDDCDIKLDNSDSENVEQKIDDPFFIGKKVIAPKLLQKENGDHSGSDVKDVKQEFNDIIIKEDLKPNRGSGDRSGKNFNKKLSESISQDELHPSWKAKKVQMIKPFEGKKIKFE